MKYKAFHHTHTRKSTELSGDGYILFPTEKNQVIDPDSAIYKSMYSKWNTREFLNKRTPINIGCVEDATLLSNPKEDGLKIYNMPIKIPHIEEYRIPKELVDYKDLIQRVINYQHSIKNKALEEDYAYLTIEQAWVNPDDFHRRPGAHTDDMQGPRYKNKLPPNQTYIVSNAITTSFYPCPFNFYNFDLNVYDLLPLIKKQATEERAYRLEPNCIYLYDSYSIHSANINTTNEPIWRTLIRIEFSQKVGDEITNTRNPLFTEHLNTWEYQKRDKPEGLISPI